MTDRTGVCICGQPVADHFGRRGRKRSCEEVLRLAIFNGTAPASAPPTGIMTGQMRALVRGPLRLVKSDRRSVS